MTGVAKEGADHFYAALLTRNNIYECHLSTNRRPKQGALLREQTFIMIGENSISHLEVALNVQWMMNVSCLTPAILTISITY